MVEELISSRLHFSLTLPDSRPSWPNDQGRPGVYQPHTNDEQKPNNDDDDDFGRNSNDRKDQNQGGSIIRENQRQENQQRDEELKPRQPEQQQEDEYDVWDSQPKVPQRRSTTPTIYADEREGESDEAKPIVTLPPPPPFVDVQGIRLR